MTNEKKSYHHGDLYSSLLAAANDIIAEGGVAALSMRKLADRVGVSRTAPYHHFKDKNELLCAIAEQGFKHHQQQLHEIPLRYAQLDGPQRFAEYVRAYINFAANDPETYDLMFGREIWKLGQPTDSLRLVSKESFRLWLSWVEQLQQQRVLPADQPTLPLAQACWATMHGLCRLLNDGIYGTAEELDAMANSAVRMMLAGSVNQADNSLADAG